MKAIVHHKYGSPDVLELAEVEKPFCMEDEVLVRVRAASVNPSQWYAMMGLFIGRMQMGWLKPKDPRLGSDFAGVVEAVGTSVMDFKKGDEVYGGRSGAFAEYISVSKGVGLKPVNLTFEEAAAVPTAALTALQGLRDHGHLQPGQKVLINGAAGGVGTFAVQIAKVFGAHVTGVCSTRNVELVRSLGADQVIDYTKEDFTRNGQRYDLFFDVAGSRAWSECKRILTPNATFVIVGGPKTNRIIGPLSHVLQIRLASMRASQKAVFFVASFKCEDLEALKTLIESGKVKPVVDRVYPMSQTAEAMRYLGTGHAPGKIVVTMEK